MLLYINVSTYAFYKTQIQTFVRSNLIHTLIFSLENERPKETRICLLFVDDIHFEENFFQPWTWWWFSFCKFLSVRDPKVSVSFPLVFEVVLSAEITVFPRSSFQTILAFGLAPLTSHFITLRKGDWARIDKFCENSGLTLGDTIIYYVISRFWSGSRYRQWCYLGGSESPFSTLYGGWEPPFKLKISL